MLNVPVALVMGTAPLKFTPPSKNDQVKVTALEFTGLITYARGARSWAHKGHARTAIRVHANVSRLTRMTVLPVAPGVLVVSNAQPAF